MVLELEAEIQFLEIITASLEQNTFVKLTLSKPTKEVPQLKNIYFRVVEIQQQLMLSATWHYNTQDQVKNYTFEEGLSLISELLPNAFLNAHLMMLSKDLHLKYNKKRKPALLDQPPTHHDLPQRSHNKEKVRLIQIENNLYLKELGLLSSNGHILKEGQKKYRQINKFIEIIDHLIPKIQLPSNEINVVDMGSGKGYLTFALYDYLFHQSPLVPNITGIELRPNLVGFCNEVAQKIGFENLQFLAQPIEQYQSKQIQMLIALHACDIATDIAIAKGIKANAELIIVAPCCHKQIRKELATGQSLQPMVKHGILAERQSEIITDSIRSLILEKNGYETKVFEFISPEHTSKNIMITANKGKKNNSAQEQIDSIKDHFGIKSHYLETLL